jgi:hypothetical protein
VARERRERLGTIDEVRPERDLAGPGDAEGAVFARSQVGLRLGFERIDLSHDARDLVLRERIGDHREAARVEFGSLRRGQAPIRRPRRTPAKIRATRIWLVLHARLF